MLYIGAIEMSSEPNEIREDVEELGNEPQIHESEDVEASSADNESFFDRIIDYPQEKESPNRNVESNLNTYYSGIINMLI